MTFNQPKSDDLNDSLADLIGNVDETKAANPVQAPEGYEPGRGSAEHDGGPHSQMSGVRFG